MNNFNAEKTTNEIIEFIRDYYNKYNLKGAVLGISGGKDSAVVSALFTKALGKENIVGVTMPCHSKDEDKLDAKLISDYYGFKLINFDLTNVFDTFKDELKNLGDFTSLELKNSDINIKPRLRMLTVYYLAALLSATQGGTYLVAGTSNKSELFVGYFTKGGDSVHDISVLGDLTVDEVIEIGKYLNVPEKVLFKTPSDGLSGQTDEDKLGVTYKDIAKYINEEELDNDTKERIKKLHNNSLHKFTIPTYRKGD